MPLSGRSRTRRGAPVRQGEGRATRKAAADKNKKKKAPRVCFPGGARGLRRIAVKRALRKNRSRTRTAPSRPASRRARQVAPPPPPRERLPTREALLALTRMGVRGIPLHIGWTIVLLGDPVSGETRGVKVEDITKATGWTAPPIMRALTILRRKRLLIRTRTKYTNVYGWSARMYDCVRTLRGRKKKENRCGSQNAGSRVEVLPGATPPTPGRLYSDDRHAVDSSSEDRGSCGIALGGSR